MTKQDLEAGGDGGEGSVRILLVDDQHMVREGIRLLLETAFRFNVCEASSVKEALTVIRAKPVDVVLLDVMMPEIDGVEGLRRILEAKPKLPVVMLSGYDDVADVRETLEMGAKGYVLKAATARQLKDAIDVALSGEGMYIHPLVAEHLLAHDSRPEPVLASLSEREREVLSKLVEGATNEDIAGSLSLAQKTVKAHLSSVFRKLGVTNRTEAVAKVMREGLLAEYERGGSRGRQGPRWSRT
jgi:DNA-binding NarL/FixJ family response regulator